ncbi:thermonuclease family protein [Bacillus gobiensis]|uniref:thermonuclease family protein n=1 Tax=Bacillus gobiensis TaxID=1441095 RepID=UPI003D1E60EE
MKFLHISFRRKRIKPGKRMSLLGLGMLLFLSGCGAESYEEMSPYATVEDYSSKNEPKAEENKTKQENPVKTAGTTDQIPVQLVQTIDGDTIKVLYNGEEKTVRYLLIDTPETKHPRLGAQPFGKEAYNRNKQLINGGEITIEFDVGERTDKYGRLLAYVYVDGKSVQEQMVKEGLARVAYVYPPNTRHLEAYENAQADAKKEQLGIWSIEDYSTDKGFVSEKDNTRSVSSNISSDEKDDMHYKNCTDVKNAGAAPIHKGDLGYGNHLDRDGDGTGCE